MKQFRPQKRGPLSTSAQKTSTPHHKSAVKKKTKKTSLLHSHNTRHLSTRSQHRGISPTHHHNTSQSLLLSSLSIPTSISSQSKRSFAINLSTIKSASTPPPAAPPAPTPPITTSPATTSAATPAAPRPRPQLKAPLTITPSAADRVMDLCSAQDPPAKGIRLGVRARGCSGMSYTMNFADAPASRLEEQVSVPNSDLKIFIDNKALLYVIGTTMDWAETDVATEFTFNNPNSKGSCGCGESFTV